MSINNELQKQGDKSIELDAHLEETFSSLKKKLLEIRSDSKDEKERLAKEVDFIVQGYKKNEQDANYLPLSLADRILDCLSLDSQDVSTTLKSLLEKNNEILTEEVLEKVLQELTREAQRLDFSKNVNFFPPRASKLVATFIFFAANTPYNTMSIGEKSVHFLFDIYTKVSANIVRNNGDFKGMLELLKENNLLTSEQFNRQQWIQWREHHLESSGHTALNKSSLEGFPDEEIIFDTQGQPIFSENFWLKYASRNFDGCDDFLTIIKDEVEDSGQPSFAEVYWWLRLNKDYLISTDRFASRLDNRDLLLSPSEVGAFFTTISRGGGEKQTKKLQTTIDFWTNHPWVWLLYPSSVDITISEGEKQVANILKVVYPEAELSYQTFKEISEKKPPYSTTYLRSLAEFSKADLLEAVAQYPEFFDLQELADELSEEELESVRERNGLYQLARLLGLSNGKLKRFVDSFRDGDVQVRNLEPLEIKFLKKPSFIFSRNKFSQNFDAEFIKISDEYIRNFGEDNDNASSSKSFESQSSNILNENNEINFEVVFEKILNGDLSAEDYSVISKMNVSFSKSRFRRTSFRSNEKEEFIDSIASLFDSPTDSDKKLIKELTESHTESKIIFKVNKDTKKITATVSGFDDFISYERSFKRLQTTFNDWHFVGDVYRIEGFSQHKPADYYKAFEYFSTVTMELGIEKNDSLAEAVYEVILRSFESGNSSRDVEAMSISTSAITLLLDSKPLRALELLSLFKNSGLADYERLVAAVPDIDNWTKVLTELRSNFDDTFLESNKVLISSFIKMLNSRNSGEITQKELADNITNFWSYFDLGKADSSEIEDVESSQLLFRKLEQFQKLLNALGNAGDENFAKMLHDGFLSENIQSYFDDEQGIKQIESFSKKIGFFQLLFMKDDSGVYSFNRDFLITFFKEDQHTFREYLLEALHFSDEINLSSESLLLKDNLSAFIQLCTVLGPNSLIGYFFERKIIDGSIDLDLLSSYVTSTDGLLKLSESGLQLFLSEIFYDVDVKKIVDELHKSGLLIIDPDSFTTIEEYIVWKKISEGSWVVNSTNDFKEMLNFLNQRYKPLSLKTVPKIISNILISVISQVGSNDTGIVSAFFESELLGTDILEHLGIGKESTKKVLETILLSTKNDELISAKFARLLQFKRGSKFAEFNHIFDKLLAFSPSLILTNEGNETLLNNKDFFLKVETEEDLKNLIFLIDKIRFSSSETVRQLQDQLIPVLLNSENSQQVIEIIDTVFSISPKYLPNVAEISLFMKLMYQFQGSTDLLKHSPLFGELSASRKQLWLSLMLTRNHLFSGSRWLKMYLSEVESSTPIIQKKIEGEPLNPSESEQLRNLLVGWSILNSLSELIKSSQVANQSAGNNLYQGFIDKFTVADFGLSSDALDELFQKYLTDIGFTEQPQNANQLLDVTAQRIYGFWGVKSWSGIKELMSTKSSEAAERNRKITSLTYFEDKEVLIKTIKSTFFESSIGESGLQSKEFFKQNADMTPGDIDAFLEQNPILLNRIPDSLYGDVFAIIENRGQFVKTKFEEGADESEEYKVPTGGDRRLVTTEKYELFISGVVGKEHVGVPVGMPATEVSAYIVLKSNKKALQNLKLTSARKGLPIKIFSPQDEDLFPEAEYEALRELFYGMEEFSDEPPIIDSDMTTYQGLLSEISGLKFEKNPTTNLSDADQVDQNNQQISSDIYGVLSNLGIATQTKQSLTVMGAEVLNIGSTGRATNMAGDADFDLIVLLDNNDWEKQADNLYDALQSNWGTAVNNSHKEDSIQYRLVKLEGVTLANGQIVDLDIGIKRKSEHFSPSVDQEVEQKLASIKKSYGEEAYQNVVGSIVLAKKLLKQYDAYKEGFKGSGTEAWILANRGNMQTACTRFLEQAKNEDGSFKTLEVFKDSNNLWSAGSNIKNSGHDSYFQKLSDGAYQGMIRMCEDFVNGTLSTSS